MAELIAGIFIGAAIVGAIWYIKAGNRKGGGTGGTGGGYTGGPGSNPQRN